MACAATFYGVLAMAGLSVFLERIGWLTRSVQIAGGLYLVWLGIQSWRHAGARGSDDGAEGVSMERHGTASFFRGLRLGSLVNLSNPKGIVFFVGLYAVAVPPDAAILTKATILAASFMVEIAWYGLVLVLLSSPPARAVYIRAGTWIERTIGIVLVAFGIRLATARA
ncbi:LysE family transporter [Rhodovulum sulfidophilum]|nr:LysE family transporter [Rhodovulum sulfidophilum]